MQNTTNTTVRVLFITTSSPVLISRRAGSICIFLIQGDPVQAGRGRQARPYRIQAGFGLEGRPGWPAAGRAEGDQEEGQEEGGLQQEPGLQLKLKNPAADFQFVKKSFYKNLGVFFFCVRSKNKIFKK